METRITVKTGFHSLPSLLAISQLVPLAYLFFAPVLLVWDLNQVVKYVSMVIVTYVTRGLYCTPFPRRTVFTVETTN